MCLKTREGRIQIANETFDILKIGLYVNEANEVIDIREDLSQAITKSKFYKPVMFGEIEKCINIIMNIRAGNIPRIDVTNETTGSAARRLVDEEGSNDTVCLNFASAKNAGGDFFGGSDAQGRSLVRASGLYSCISKITELNYYSIYSDYIIYSPKVPVIRDDEDRLMDNPFLLSFITAPDVSAGLVRGQNIRNTDKVHGVMMERIRKSLWVAALNGNKTIVLGAHRQGIFKNRTEYVAEYFRAVLIDEGYASLFDNITFAIYDDSREQKTINIFKDAFGIRY